MTKGITVKRKFHARREGRGRKAVANVNTVVLPGARIPRISRLMALAIRFDQLIRDGVVSDQAELARIGHVSRARLTQITNLLSLAPDLQDKVLFQLDSEPARIQLTERNLRSIVSDPNWQHQRQAFRTLLV